MRGMRRVAPLLLIVLAPLLLGMSKRQPFSISFHGQGSATDMPKTIFPFTLDGRSLYFKVLPEMSHENIAAFHAFPAPTGDYGVALQMDFRGRNALELTTRANPGGYLLAMVNGRPVDYVVMDQVITNGMITIWQGVPETVVKELEKKYPRIRPGAPPSMTDKFEMAPTTKKEKKSFFERFKREEREAERRRKAGEDPHPSPVQEFNLPQAPVSPQIPVEGAAPAVPGMAPLPQ